MPGPIELTIDEREFGPVGIDLLAGILGELCAKDQAEVRLSQENGPSLRLRKSGGRALLLVVRGPGDPGTTSRAEASETPGRLSFTLGNGQVDEYPAAWTVPFDAARQAAECFWFRRGPAPFVTWHDDAVVQRGRWL